jgi:hypothetical protein
MVSIFSHHFCGELVALRTYFCHCHYNQKITSPQYTMNTTAIKHGPKPRTNDGDLDERRRVSQPNVPKYNPPLKPHKPKPKK